MDLFAVIEKFGIPVAVACAFGFFIWRQIAFIQNELMQELEQDFKRIEMIIIKLIDQQKKMQIEQRGILKSYQALVEIVTNLIKKEK